MGKILSLEQFPMDHLFHPFMTLKCVAATAHRNHDNYVYPRKRYIGTIANLGLPAGEFWKVQKAVMRSQSDSK